MWPESQGVRETLPWVEHTSEDVAKIPISTKHSITKANSTIEKARRSHPHAGSNQTMPPHPGVSYPSFSSRWLLLRLLLKTNPPLRNGQWDITGSLVRVYDFYPFMYFRFRPQHQTEISFGGLASTGWCETGGHPPWKFVLLLDRYLSNRGKSLRIVLLVRIHTWFLNHGWGGGKRKELPVWLPQNTSARKLETERFPC